MSRRDRRAQVARGAVLLLNVECAVCKARVFSLPQGEALSKSGKRRPGIQQRADSAMRAHCRTTGCVKLEELKPVSLPGRP